MTSSKLASSSAVRVTRAALTALFVSTLACSGGGTAEPGDPDPMPTVAFELALSSEKLPVLTGDSATIEVTLTRAAGFDGAVTLSPAGLPPQATATFSPETLATGQTRSTLTVVAPAGTPHSLPTAVTIRGAAGDKQVTKALTVTITGAPGTLDTSFGGRQGHRPRRHLRRLRQRDGGAARRQDHRRRPRRRAPGRLRHRPPGARRHAGRDVRPGDVARQGADRLRRRRGDRVRRGRAARRQDRRRRHVDGDRQRPGLRARALQQRRQPGRRLRIPAAS